MTIEETLAAILEELKAIRLSTPRVVVEVQHTHSYVYPSYPSGFLGGGGAGGQGGLPGGNTGT